MITQHDIANLEAINKAIANRRSWIADIREMLPYADHGAYGQDKQRIRWYEDEIRQLEFHRKQLEERNGGKL